MNANGAIHCTAVTTELVVLTICANNLKVLLVARHEEPYGGAWALPGRYLGTHHGLTACARQELEERAGLTELYLEQLYSFGKPQRITNARVVSVAYFALVPPHRRPSFGGERDALLRWFPLDRCPALPFDHAEIVALAHRRLLDKLAYSTIALQLMPQQFTLSELQSVHETLLGEKLDKRNFRKRIRAWNCIEDTGHSARYGSHRPARLYRLKAPGQVETIK